MVDGEGRSGLVVVAISLRRSQKPLLRATMRYYHLTQRHVDSQLCHPEKHDQLNT